ncbi:MAG: hypothetical protein VB859_00970, partial [Planctomycetaceae bacterium]
MKIPTILCLAGFPLLLLVGFLPGAATPAADDKAAPIREDWSDWRGPRRDGISRETGLLLDWRASKPRRIWQRELPVGYSSMTVVGDRLFTMGAEADAEYIYCLSIDDGGTLWKVHSGTTFKNSYGNGPRGTPVIDGNRV